jgi:hypothetical protein
MAISNFDQYGGHSKLGHSKKNINNRLILGSINKLKAMNEGVAGSRE